MSATIAELVEALPGPPSDHWPEGVPFVRAMAYGSMSVELYAPNEIDRQQPHTQDELYIIERGRGIFRLGEERLPFAAGSVFLVPAGADHRFESFTDDFRTWVVFWGPKGGEHPHQSASAMVQGSPVGDEPVAYP